METAAVWVVLGPEPEVGTTEVAEGLILALRRRGERAVGVMPVDAACVHDDEHDLESRVGTRLWHASERTVPPLVVAPYRFHAGANPVEAAEAAGLSLSLVDLLSTIEDAAQFGGPVVAVGPPQADAPYATDGTAWDFARAANARVLVVVDDERLSRLDELRTRAVDERVQIRVVARTAQPIEGAIHLPPNSSISDAATKLTAALDA